MECGSVRSVPGRVVENIMQPLNVAPAAHIVLHLRREMLSRTVGDCSRACPEWRWIFRSIYTEFIDA
jgi:hypothetical protein